MPNLPSVEAGLISSRHLEMGTAISEEANDQPAHKLPLKRFLLGRAPTRQWIHLVLTLPSQIPRREAHTDQHDYENNK